MTSSESDDIDNPVLEVTRHCAIRGIQLGSTLGAVVGVPTALFWKKLTSPSAILHLMGSYSFFGASTGMVASIALGIYRMSTSTDEENYDRAYRLRWNYHQNRVDVYSGYGAAIGGLVGGALSQSAAGLSRGGALGVVGALLVHALTPVPADQLPSGYH